MSGKHITLIFSRRHHLGSWAIRIGTWSEYSHVDVLIGENLLIGAIYGKGVITRSLDDLIAKSSKVVMMHVPVDDVDAAIAFAMGQKGKKYDKWGAIGIGFKQDWQDDDKWSCAEFATGVLAGGDQRPFDSEFYPRIVPQHLLMLNYPKVRIK